MYMDRCGDTEANYTVLALFTNHSVNRSDVTRRRTMRPVGDFRTGKLTSPVGVASSDHYTLFCGINCRRWTARRAACRASCCRGLHSTIRRTLLVLLLVVVVDCCFADFTGYNSTTGFTYTAVV